MQRRLWMAVLVATSMPAGSGLLFAQAEKGFTERYARQRPLLRIRSDVPTAPVLRLGWAQHDGSLWLYAGGFDKLVRRWRVRFSATGELELEAAEPLRWPLFRGNRGAIYALDVVVGNATGHLAVGGLGAKAPQVNHFFAEEFTRSEVLLDISQEGEVGTTARQAVWDVSFDRSGRFLAVGEGAHSGGSAANLLLWSLDASGHSLCCCRTALRDVKHVQFSPSGEYLAVAGPSLDGKGPIVEIRTIGALTEHLRPPGKRVVVDVEPIRSRRLRASDPDAIRGLVWLDSNTWAAATKAGMLIGSVDGSPAETRFATVGEDEFVYAGMTVEKLQEEDVVELSNRWRRPVQFRAAVLSNASQEPNWSSVEDLRPGEVRRFRTSYALAVQRIVAGRSLGVSRLPRGHRLAFCPYVAAIDFAPNRYGALALWDEDVRQVVLRTPQGDAGPKLESAEFEDIHAVAVCAEPPLVAVAGLERLSGPNDASFAVYGLRVWSAESGKLLARLPAADRHAGPPSLGGPISAVAIRQAAGEPDAVQFTIGPTSGRDEATVLRFLPADRFAGIRPVPADEATSRRLAAGRLYLDSRDPAEAVAVVVTPGAELKAGEEVIARVPVGRVFQPEKRQGQWLLVENPSASATQTGWIHRSHLLPMVRRFMRDAAGNRVGPFLFTADNPPLTGIRFRQGGRSFAAVGLADGIRIWDLERLARGEGLKALVRSFYGHEAQITCLDAAQDGSWLVSGSLDGTICAWGLKRLGEENPLGVRLGPDGVITDVLEGSPAWDAGFTAGDVVVGAQIAGLPVRPDQLVAAIRQAIPSLELYAVVERNGRRIQLLTPVSRDPLWTFYPQHDGYWVMWTPSGLFDSASSQADQFALSDDERLEWVVNLGGATARVGIDEGVVSLGASDFARLYRDVESLSDVVLRGEPARIEVPLPPEIVLTVDQGRAAVSARPTGRSQRVVERQLFLNGRLLARDAEAPSRRQAPLTAAIPAESLRHGRNTLVAVAVVESSGKRAYFRRVRHFFEDRPSAGTPRLHLVAVGVADLSAELSRRLGVTPLKFPDDDVRRAAELLRQRIDRRHWQEGFFRVLADGTEVPPTRKHLLAALEELASQVRPDDLAIVMLSGHGFLEDGAFRFVAADGALRQQELAERLYRLSCRTLLLLDTCHSEAAGGIDRQLEDLARLVPGPLVLTSCGRNELSEEDPRLGHGVFTAALLEALDGRPRFGRELPFPRDPDGDGSVSVAELCRYVEARTPHLIDALRIPRARQHPQIVSSVVFLDANRLPLVPVRKEGRQQP